VLRKGLFLLASVGLLLLSSAARAQVWVPTPVPADAPAEVKAIVAQADTLYDAREKPGNMDECLQVLRTASTHYPNSYPIQWRLARSLFWVSEATADHGLHGKLAEEGDAAGKRAIAANPEGTEGLYFDALCIGEIAHAVSILTALARGLEGSFRDPLLKTEKLNPGIDNGGLYNALGRYKYELPWPKRDLDASAQYLHQALVTFQPDLRGRVFLAETLAARDHKGDVEEGKRLLKEVLSAPVGRYNLAEELRSQGLARAAAQRLKWDLQ